MMQYQSLLGQIIQYGTEKGDRTGTGTRSIFGHQMRFDLSEGFPLVTTKKVHFKSVVHELLWMLSGQTNVAPLQREGVTIWDEWADENGELGPVYGKQWRKWTTYKRGPDGTFLRASLDQINHILQALVGNPDSRRMVVSAWNPAELDQMKLAPCHCLFQFNTRPMTLNQRLKTMGFRECVDRPEGGYIEGTEDRQHAALDEMGAPSRYLDCQLYQRSCDVFLGVPFNIASYALLVHMVAQVVGMVPGDFIWTGGDVHLYLNHLDQAREQLSREIQAYPTIRLNPDVKDLFAFRYEDITLEGYRPLPAIKAPVAV